MLFELVVDRPNSTYRCDTAEHGVELTPEPRPPQRHIAVIDLDIDGSRMWTDAPKRRSYALDQGRIINVIVGKTGSCGGSNPDRAVRHVAHRCINRISRLATRASHLIGNESSSAPTPIRIEHVGDRRSNTHSDQ
jgi:hypothetical protein